MPVHPHVIILAAGKGTRMQSDLPKVLHRLDGLPLLRHVVFTAGGLEPTGMTVVVGYQADVVRYAVDEEEGQCVVQKEQLGTGHAVQVALQQIPADQDPILVLYGDVPLIRESTLHELVKQYEQTGADAVLITGILDDPFGYGRILRDADGNVVDIVEEKDASDEQKAIKEANIGVGLYRRKPLDEALAKMDNDNAQGEYYLTDMPRLMRELGYRTETMVAEDVEQFQGVNTPEQLAKCEEILARRG